MLPLAILLLRKRFAIIDVVSPIAICYGAGIAAGNISPVPFDEKTAVDLCGLAVLLAIPLLLFGVDVLAWARLAKKTVLAMLLGYVAVIVSATSAAYFFRDTVSGAGMLAGMMSGLFTGGTVNMAAIGQALGVEPEIFVLVNVADVTVCGLYYLALLAGGYKLYEKVLGIGTGNVDSSNSSAKMEEGTLAGSAENEFGAVDTSIDDEFIEEDELAVSVREYIRPMLVALGIAGIAVGLMEVLPKSWSDIVAVLVVSTLGISLSFVKRIRALRGAYGAGDYMLLVFAVSMGSIARIEKLFASGAGIYLLFFGVVLGATLLLHLLLCKLMGIDAHTMIVTSIAGLFGPPFVPPVASRLKQPELVVGGIGCGLLGIASGTYIGILLGTFLVNHL